MWIIFFVAALLMLAAGVGGSFVVEFRRELIPPQIMAYMHLIENVGVTGGIGLCLLGVAMCYRKLRWVGRRRGASGRSGRTRAIDFPRRTNDAEEAPEPEDGDTPPSEQPTLLFGGQEDEPGTRKMRRIGRR